VRQVYSNPAFICKAGWKGTLHSTLAVTCSEPERSTDNQDMGAMVEKENSTTATKDRTPTVLDVYPNRQNMKVLFQATSRPVCFSNDLGSINNIVEKS
jgi:hypothetical protein